MQQQGAAVFRRMRMRRTLDSAFKPFWGVFSFTLFSLVHTCCARILFSPQRQQR